MSAINRVLICLAAVAVCCSVEAASQKDLLQLSFFSIMLGRAVVCLPDQGDAAATKVSTWVAKKLTAEERDRMFKTIAEQITEATIKQRFGGTSGPCSDVVKYFDSEEFRRALAN